MDAGSTKPDGGDATGAEGPPADLRIEELSQLSQVSIRNIREYQDRGILPAPRREGRLAIYSADHLVRLRLISRLLGRGYPLAVIRDLLNAWADGRDLDDVLGLESVVSRPWGEEDPVDVTQAELAVMFKGTPAEADVAALTRAGILLPRRRGYLCLRPRLLQAVPTLIEAGIPASAGVALLAQARGHLDAVADGMVELVVQALLPEGTPHGLPEGAALARLTASIEQLRAVADLVVGSLFGLAMQDAVDRAVDATSGRALQDVDRRRGGVPDPPPGASRHLHRP